jgi:cytochrome P450
VRALVWPTRFFDDCARRYGEYFTLRTPLERTLVFTSDPEAVRAVFRGDPDVFHAGEGNAVLGPLLGSSSLLLLDEGEHLRQRRLLLPGFHGDRMRAYGELMTRTTEREIAAWPRGSRFPALPSMQAITLDVIMQAVLGVKDGPEADALRRGLRRVLDQLGDRRRLALLALTSSKRGPRSPWGRFRATIGRADRLLMERIAAHRADPGLADRTDVLASLLQARDEEGRGLDDGELRDQLMTLLVAGHETTATALAWTLERLVRHPEVLERLEAETAAGHDEYLEAVLKESLRLRPVVPAITRRLTRPVELGGWHLPAGVHVNPSIYLLHRRPDIYPAPERFRPERFLEREFAHHEWLPFGGGTRRCLGASFALFEMRTVLATVVRTWRLRPESARDEPVGRRAITFVPARGGRIAVEPA